VPCFVYDGAPADELIDYACDLAGVRERDREAIYLVRMGSPVASDGVILGTWEGETMLLSKRA
jgi:formylmethanofuran dehydrogenase subunit A